MNAKSRIVIHVGVGKTGTTSLQQNIFAKLSDIDCLWRPNHQVDDCRDFSLGIRLGEDHKLEAMCLPFVERVRDSKKKMVILSDESIRSDVDSLAAARLARYFPDAHILITIRNQITVLPSYYRDSGRLLKRSPVEDRSLFVSWPEFIDFTINKPWLSVARQFKYYDLAKTYQRHFDKVSILTFEEMTKSPEVFFSELADILDTDQQTLLDLWQVDKAMNTGESGRLLTYMDWRSRLPIKRLPIPNALRQFAFRWLKRGQVAKVDMTDDQRRAISDFYASDNRDLEREFNIKVASLGYPT